MSLGTIRLTTRAPRTKNSLPEDRSVCYATGHWLRLSLWAECRRELFHCCTLQTVLPTTSTYRQKRDLCMELLQLPLPLNYSIHNIISAYQPRLSCLNSSELSIRHHSAILSHSPNALLTGRCRSRKSG